MNLLAPTALVFAALGIPIILLYMLKLRRRDVLVSSTFLWQRLLRDREANAPWQRLRSNLLLLLQLLVLLLLTVALARPFLFTPVVIQGDVVILLDRSASMQATDVQPSRFEAARQAAEGIVDDLGSGDAASLIAVGPRPAILAAATSDRAVLRRALDGVAPSNGAADWETAFALVAAAASGAGETQIVIISDGAMPESLPPLPGEVHFVQVGAGSENLGITVLAAREGSSGLQAFLQVANWDDAPADVAVELWADGVLFDVRRLDIPAHGDSSIALDDLPYDLSLLEARLANGDSLALDDVAWTVRSTASTRRVLLVTPGNLFLERALEMLPGIELTRLSPNQPLPSEPYDLVVCDGPITATLPPGNLWAIGPSADATGFFTDTVLSRVASDHPLMRYVDLGAVHVLRAWAVEPPPGARVLAEAAGGPLLLVAERPEGRWAALTFSLHESDLPLQVAFPILVSNLTNWLLPQGGVVETTALHPGQPIAMQPDPEATRILVTAPDGAAHVLAVGEAPPLFAATDLPGVYHVAQFGAGDELLRSDRFAVNLFDAAESDIAPQETIWIGQAAVGAAVEAEQGQREFWPWLAVIALGVMGVEWWAYYRGLGRQNKRMIR
ncbi:MAG: BatA and WFA domain-containing protein [Anaerolineae bacterium]|nr:BatA and WFA domain-containing protein [Anaerolineae bacterium]